MARTVVFDFDGVIHSYSSGWKGADCIPDPPVPGIEKALAKLHQEYEIAIVSSRCSTQAGVDAINHWLYKNGLAQYVDKVCKEKPPAIVYIDDRAICFDGHPETLLKKIQNFQPWYKKPTLPPPNEWVSRLRELDELYTKLHAVPGFTVEQLLEMFAAGYTLEKHDYSKSFEEMASLLEYEKEHANAYYEECGQWEAENTQLKEKLEALKQDRDFADEYELSE